LLIAGYQPVPSIDAILEKHFHWFQVTQQVNELPLALAQHLSSLHPIPGKLFHYSSIHNFTFPPWGK
jgi:hypothetical protein